LFNFGICLIRNCSNLKFVPIRNLFHF
jgi:hypothetical protein